MIKVGDWVNVIINVEDGKVVHNRIAKCHNHRNGFVHYFNGDRIVYAIEENIEKLPVKFKPFQIKQGEEDIAYIIEETRVLHKNTRAIKFKAVQIHEGGLCEVILHTDGKTQTRWGKNSKTIEQAKDWLELQYATMIAKARGLV